MRVPLHVKLMLSYLLVVGLVVLPTFVYVRTVQRAERRQELRLDLKAQLQVMARVFGEVPPGEALDQLVLRTVRMSHRRLTVIDVDGRVLAESTGEAEHLANHRDRPEVKAALEGGDGFACDSRTSATLHIAYDYCAQRYPLEGPPRGVLRLAVSAATLEGAESRSQLFLNRMGAVALSVAFVLSLLAAYVVVRPLRKLTEGARAFARGDFGHVIGVRSRDELGDVVDALENLAAQLRDRLLSAGADRATLHALLDELPVGVVLYDEKLHPTVVSASARQLLDVTPATERQRLHAFVVDPVHRAAIDGVLADGLPRDVPLARPPSPDAAFTARWVSVFAANGSREVALVVAPVRDASPASVRRAPQTTSTPAEVEA